MNCARQKISSGTQKVTQIWTRCKHQVRRDVDQISNMFWLSFRLTRVLSEQKFTPAHFERTRPQAIDVLNFSRWPCSPTLGMCPSTGPSSSKTLGNMKSLHIEAHWHMQCSSPPVPLQTLEVSREFLPDLCFLGSPQRMRIVQVLWAVCEWMLCEKPWETFPAAVSSGNIFLDRKRNPRNQQSHHIRLGYSRVFPADFSLLWFLLNILLGST